MTVGVAQKRPLGITIVVVLADFGALLRLIGAVVVIVVAVAAPSQVPGGTRAMMVGLSIFASATALGILLVGHSLWKGANWARITFMAILFLAVVVAVIRMLLAGVDGESVISVATSVVCLGILHSASARGYCPPAPVPARSARIVVAGILNIAYGALGYLILSLSALVAWTVVASRYRATAFYFRRRFIGLGYDPVLWLLQVGIAVALTACCLLCVCLIISGIGILLVKERARRLACVTAGAFLVSTLILMATCICAEVADFPVLGSALGLAGTAILAALVVAALAWPVTMNFLLTAAPVKVQFAESIPPVRSFEPETSADLRRSARVRREERKDLFRVCLGLIAFFIAIALLGTALPGIRWRANPREAVPLALKRPTRLMRQGKHTAAIPLLAEALKSDDVATWRRAADALAEIGEPALPALVEILNNGKENISPRAEMVLSKMGPAALAVYTERLDSPNERVRRIAVFRIAQMGTEGIPGLFEALKSNDRNVRFNAVEALRKIGAPAVPALKEAAKDPDSFIRSRATEILRQIAAHDTAAVEALADAVKDESGKTLLHYAAEVGNTKAMESFIKKGGDLNATDASGNTALSAIVEKMMMGPRRADDYTRYRETARFLIASGADVDATARFGRTLLQQARSLGREDVADFLIAQGAQAHFDRRIYFKLPLEGVRFHWRFFDRTAYLQGHLLLRISGKDEVAQEITVFKQGKVADGWHIIGAGPQGPIGDGAYFGFQSSLRYPTAQGDAVELELEVAEDLLGGWGPEDYGILQRGAYQTKGRIRGVSDEPQVFEVGARQERSPGWTAFPEWDARWKLVTDNADGIVTRGCINTLASQDRYACLQAAQVLG
ncbi:MAG: HEAT repeat domain-containing protein, partial [Planctomycetota bacterium]